MEAFGIHCISELFGCPAELLNDVAFVRQAVRDAAGTGMATLLHEVSHKFHPQGVTALGLISESHIAIHTWPECGYAAVDVFTCGQRASAEKACEHLVRAFEATTHVTRKLERGLGVTAPATNGGGVNSSAGKASSGLASKARPAQGGQPGPSPQATGKSRRWDEMEVGRTR